MKYLIVICFICGLWASLWGQDLSALNFKQPLKFNGGLSIGGSFYGANGTENRRSPGAWYVNGSSTLTVLGISVPFSFSLKDQRYSLSSPFNRVGLSPGYKWVRLHLGYRNMQFSPYTLAGHTFLGAGMELNPGKFRFAVMYGELLNPLSQIDTLVTGAVLIKDYKRKAYAGKIGFGGSKSHFDLIVFKARDEIKGVDVPEAQSLPAENLVVGIDTRVTFFKVMQFQLNAAGSAFTRNQQASEVQFDSATNQALQIFDPLLDPNLSTRLNFAGEAGLSLNLSRFRLGLNYQRVDPLYASLGAYYFQDDYENYTLSTYMALFKNKVVISGNAGYQRNNLLNLRSFTTLRRIGYLMAAINPGPTFGLTLNYSNFNFNQQSGLVAINDTLRFVQTTSMAGFSPRFSYQVKGIPHTITLSVNYQEVADLNEFNATPQSARIANGYLNYAINWKAQNFSIQGSLNYNNNVVGGNENERLGIGAGANKSFFAKTLTWRGNVNYSLNRFNQQEDGWVLSLNTSATYRIRKKQSLSLNVFYLNRNTKIQNPFSEWRGAAGYQFNF